MTTTLDLTGLKSDEVLHRVDRGQANRTTTKTNRTTGRILRDNLLTRFNLLLGALLFVVLVILREPRDALFGLVLISNSAIGIIQELRAKRTLDRLALIATPKVRVVRDGSEIDCLVEDVVLDDLIRLSAGDQIVVDGVVVESQDLEIDESLLTGESRPVKRLEGEDLLSGSFVVAGSGHFQATKVGDDSYATRLAAEAKQYSPARSELRAGIDWVLGAVSWAVVPVGLFVLWTTARYGGLEAGLTGAVAAGVALIPQGLVLLTSIAFALGVIRLGRRNVLVQELPALEGLARVDVVCIDKTGTLTEAKIAVDQLIALSERDADAGLAALASLDDEPNPTIRAIADCFAEVPNWDVVKTVAFSSERKWSGATFTDAGSWVLGAPEIVAGANEEATRQAADFSETGARVLVVAWSGSPLEDGVLPRDLEPCALVILTDKIRPDAAETVQYFADQEVTIKVISGDNSRTASSVAAAVGIEHSDRYMEGGELPEDPGALGEIMESHAVFGRVSPQQKRDMVEALQSRGHVVAMIGDGVNDVLALKVADVGVAVGSGAPASRAVAKLILIDGRFASMPAIVAEGRRVAFNIERVANLFITSTVYALGLALAVSLAGLPYPFLPRHLTLVGSLTVGIPAFFIALEATHRRARPGFIPRVLRFALPVGLVATASTFLGYWIAESENASVDEARTIATLILASVGFFAVYLVSRPLVPWKSLLIATLVAALLVVMAVPSFREFFALSMPRPALTLAAAGIAAVTGTLMWAALRAIGWTRTLPAAIRDRLPDTKG